MNVKAIIFDVDEVLIQVPHYFTQELENIGYRNAVAIMNEYYGNENTLCAEGKEQATKLILPYLERIGWNKGVKKYFKEQFIFERQYVETALIDLIPKLQKLGIKCYLGTDQEDNRATFLLEGLDFRNIFDGYFISCYVGSRKGSSKFWDYVKNILGRDGINKEEIVFFDDLQENIDTAKISGIQAFLFTDMQQFKKDLEKLNISI